MSINKILALANPKDNKTHEFEVQFLNGNYHLKNMNDYTKMEEIIQNGGYHLGIRSKDPHSHSSNGNNYKSASIKDSALASYYDKLDSIKQLDTIDPKKYETFSNTISYRTTGKDRTVDITYDSPSKNFRRKNGENVNVTEGMGNLPKEEHDLQGELKEIHIPVRGDGMIKYTESSQSHFQFNDSQSVLTNRTTIDPLHETQEVYYEDFGLFIDMEVMYRFTKGSEKYRQSRNYTFFTERIEPVAVWIKENNFCQNNIEKKKEIKNFENVHKAPIVLFEATITGTKFVTCDAMNQCLIWNTEEWEIEESFLASTKNHCLSSVVWSPCENFLAFGGMQNITIWHVDIPKNPKKLYVFNEAHHSNITNLLYTNDGKYLVSASGSSSDNIIKFWGLADRNLELEITITHKWFGINRKEYNEAIELLRMDPKDKYLQSVAHKSNILFDMANSDRCHTFNYKKHITEAKFTKCSKYIIAGVDCSIEVLRKKTGEVLKRMNLVHSGELEQFAFDESGGFLASCCKGKVFLLHKYSHEALVDKIIEEPGDCSERKIKLQDQPEILDLPIIDTFEARSSEYRRSQNYIAFNKSGECIITWVKDTRFLQQDMGSKSLIDTFDSQHKSKIVLFHYSPSAEYFITGDIKNNIIVWDSETLHVVQRYSWGIENPEEAQEQNIFCAAWKPCEKFFAIGGFYNIKIFDFSGKLNWLISDEIAFKNNPNKLPVSHIDFSPNCQLVAASCGYEIKVWDLKTRQQIVHLEDPHNFKDFKGKLRYDKVTHQAFSKCGLYLYSSSDNIDKLWNIKTNFDEVEEFRSNYNTSCFDFSPCGRYILIGTDEGGLILYDIIEMQKVLYNETEGQAALTSLKFSHCGNFIASIDNNKFAKLYEIEYMDENNTNKKKDTQCNKNRQKSANYSESEAESQETENQSDEDEFTPLANPNVKKVYGLEFLEETQDLGRVSHRNKAQLENITFSGDGKLVLFNCLDDELKLIDANTKQTKGSQKDHHKGKIICAKFSPDNKFFFSAGRDNRVILWDSTTLKRQHVYNLSEIELEPGAQTELLKHIKKENEDENIQNIFDACWTPDGEAIIVAGLFSIWQVDLIEKEKQVLLENCFTTHGHKYVDFAPEGDRLICSDMFNFRLIELENFTHIFKKERPHVYYNIYNECVVDPIKSLSYTKCGRFILTCADNSNIFWDSEKGTKIYSISGNHKISTVSYNYDGSLLAAGCHDRSIKLFDMNNLRFAFELSNAHDYQITSIAISPEGYFLITGDAGCRAKIFELKGEEEKRKEAQNQKSEIFKSKITQSNAESLDSILEDEDENIVPNRRQTLRIKLPTGRESKRESRDNSMLGDIKTIHSPKKKFNSKRKLDSYENLDVLPNYNLDDQNQTPDDRILGSGSKSRPSRKLSVIERANEIRMSKQGTLANSKECSGRNTPDRQQRSKQNSMDRIPDRDSSPTHQRELSPNRNYMRPPMAPNLSSRQGMSRNKSSGTAQHVPHSSSTEYLELNHASNCNDSNVSQPETNEFVDENTYASSKIDLGNYNTLSLKGQDTGNFDTVSFHKTPFVQKQNDNITMGSDDNEEHGNHMSIQDGSQDIQHADNPYKDNQTFGIEFSGRSQVKESKKELDPIDQVNEDCQESPMKTVVHSEGHSGGEISPSNQIYNKANLGVSIHSDRTNNLTLSPQDSPYENIHKKDLKADNGAPYRPDKPAVSIDIGGMNNCLSSHVIRQDEDEDAYRTKESNDKPQTHNPEIEGIGSFYTDLYSEKEGIGSFYTYLNNENKAKFDGSPCSILPRQFEDGQCIIQLDNSTLESPQPHLKNHNPEKHLAESKNDEDEQDDDIGSKSETILDPNDGSDIRGKDSHITKLAQDSQLMKKKPERSNFHPVGEEEEEEETETNRSLTNDYSNAKSITGGSDEDNLGFDSEANLYESSKIPKPNIERKSAQIILEEENDYRIGVESDPIVDHNEVDSSRSLYAYSKTDTENPISHRLSKNDGLQRIHKDPASLRFSFESDNQPTDPSAKNKLKKNSKGDDKKNLDDIKEDIQSEEESPILRTIDIRSSLVNERPNLESTLKGFARDHHSVILPTPVNIDQQVAESYVSGCVTPLDSKQTPLDTKQILKDMKGNFVESQLIDLNDSNTTGYDTQEVRKDSMVIDTQVTEDDDEEEEEDGYEFYRPIRLNEELPLIKTFVEQHTFYEISENLSTPVQVEFSKDSKKLLINLEDKEFCIFNMESLEKEKVFDNAHYCKIISTRYVNDGNQILTAGIDNMIYLWDAHTYKLIETIDNYIDGDHNKQNIHSLDISSCGRYFAIGGLTSISIFSLKDWVKIIDFPNAHKNPIYMVEFYINPNWLCSADKESVRIWNMEEEKFENEIFNPHLTSLGKVDPIYHVDLSYCGKYIQTCAEESDKQWGTKEQKEIPEFSHDSKIQCSFFTKNGKQLVGGCKGGFVKVWGLDLYLIDFVYEDPEHDVPISLAVSNDGGRIVCGYENQMITVFGPVYMTYAQQSVFEYKREIQLQSMVNSKRRIPEVVLPNVDNFEDWGHDLKNIEWNGFYIQDDIKEELDVGNLIINKYGKISGSGEDSIGRFELAGCVNYQKKNIQFTKKYEIGHGMIEFTGTIGGDNSIIGNWDDQGSNSGEFEIKPYADEYKGFHLDELGNRISISMHMVFKPEGIFGIGVNERGEYILKGDWNLSAGVCRFVISYLDQYDICYVGSANQFKERINIKGTWQIVDYIDQIYGKFELNKFDPDMSYVRKTKNNTPDKSYETSPLYSPVSKLRNSNAERM